MSTRPIALQLADVHEDGSDFGDSTAAELRRLHFENLEQARLLGMSAEREVALIAKIEEHAEKLKYDIHSCGPTCERYVCVATRNAVANEREACAKVCEQSDRYRGEYFAALIRERVNK